MRAYTLIEASIIKENKINEEIEILINTGLFKLEYRNSFHEVGLFYSLWNRKLLKLIGTNIYITINQDGKYKWIKSISYNFQNDTSYAEIDGQSAFDSVPDSLKEQAIYNINLFV